MCAQSLNFQCCSPRDRSLSAQPISTRKPQSIKNTSTLAFAHLVNFPKIICAMFDNHKTLLFWLLTCSGGVIFDSCSDHVILTYYVRKGSWVCYLNYPQINEVGKSDHVASNKRNRIKTFYQQIFWNWQNIEQTNYVICLAWSSGWV